MNLRRGHVILARFPHASGGRGKKRPVVVVTADVYNQRLRHAVVAQVTTNLADQNDPACLFIAAQSPAGQAAGLNHDSIVCCYLLILMSEERLQNKIGELSPDLLASLDGCLSIALGIGSPP